MQGKIILNLAMSIDGYIANEEGEFDWIVGDGNEKLNTEEKFDFEKFMKDIDVVVMGRNCCNDGFHNDYPEKEVYIATSEEIEDYDNYHFINKDIVDTIIKLKEEGKNIYLFGGAVTIDPFIKADVIDEYIIGVIPTILGKGRRLFLENNPKIDLSLQSYVVDGGITILKYLKRRE